MPKISVVLPAYNAEKYIREAVESILSQTYQDFELLIINDGSTDNTKAIVLSIKDDRIVYIENEINLGLIGSLNKGLGLARGRYIARMDADDISEPTRFGLQFNFLENNPDYVICSCARMEFSDDNSDTHISRLPLDDVSIRVQSLFSTPFTHPGVMFRRVVVVDNGLLYDAKFKYAEDYAFWVNLLRYGKGYNFKEVLLKYRIVPTGQTAVGVKREKERKATISTIQQLAASQFLDITLNVKEQDFLYILSLSEKIKQIDFDIFSVIFVRSFFDKVYEAPAKSLSINKSGRRKILGKLYLKILVFNREKLTLTQLTSLIFARYFLWGVNNYAYENK